MKYKRLSIVIPVYNEEKFIEKCLDVVAQADSCGLEKEIIVIDDGSNDNTKSKIKNLRRYSRSPTPDDKCRGVGQNSKLKIKTIFKNKNEGKGAAVKAGFLKSTGDIVLVQDSDLEYSPDDYPLLIEPFLKNDADVVYGSRFVSNRPHRVLYFWHYVINVFLTTLSNMLTNLNLTDMETGFKVFKGEIIRKIAPKLESKKFGFEPEVTARIAKIPELKIFEVGISYSGRTYQEGKKIYWLDGIRAIFEIIKFNLF